MLLKSQYEQLANIIIQIRHASEKDIPDVGVGIIKGLITNFVSKNDEYFDAEKWDNLIHEDK
tara:strand:- start:337 stop:522 length:186 start_codon:yes stop_codon:yes gene_type:complete